ncbi:hypothetical protein [Pseudomonas sp. NPDC087804]|uniref:hypothetical protein n=1 Tax=Pseudomonas sp. NPDC087804 TaxID=3364449 RepID=UPI0037F8D838
MINFRQLAKLLLATVFTVFFCSAGVSSADIASPNPTVTEEHSAKVFKPAETISTISPTENKSTKIETTTETELKILKEKNTLISEFQSSLISIVLWSLAAVVSVVVLLVGASIFTNFKMHQKDIQRIQLDYDAKINIFRSEIDASLAKAGQEMTNAQEVRSQQDLDRMLDQASQLRNQFETVRTALEEKSDHLLSETNKCNTSIGVLEATLATLSAELRKAETRIWEIKKIPENVLLTALQGIDSSIVSESKWRIRDFIDQVKEVLKSDFIKTGLKLDKELQRFTEKRMIALESTYPEDVQEIRKLVAECADLTTD